jgi:hypothetical protein
MPEKSVVYEGKLPNGIDYRIHHAQGFAKSHAELAIEVAGEFIQVTTLVLKRSGNIEIIPTMGCRMSLHPQGATQEEPQDNPSQDEKPAGDLLSDVLPSSQQQGDANG